MGIVHAKSPPQMRNATQEQWKPLDEVSARVDKIHFDGIKRTKDDVLLHVVGELLQAQSMEEVVLKAHGVRQQLETLQAFKSIDIILDTSTGPDASPNGLEVIFNVKERSRVDGNINIMTGNNEGSLLFRLLLPNMFGRGEALSTDYQYGKKTAGFNITSTKPFLNWANPRLNQFVFGNTTEYPWSGYQEKLNGLGAEVSFESSPQVQHTLRWEGVWRNLRCLSPTTPFEIREEAGHTVKSCVKHILCMDQRDDPCLPFRGSYFRLYQEYAGLGGNVSFLKHEVQYQINKCVLGDLVLQATLMGGLVRTIGLDRSVRINDRFFLGGPLSLRGFSMNGVGPHANDCFLGAEAYWAGALHAYAPLPFRPLKQVLDKICRTHLFLNTGNIGNFAFTDDYHHNTMVLLSRLRWSWGFGVVLAVGGIARFELNYCVPISSQPGDRAQEGLQFGLGINFL
ncbi:sorting and assembly machinery component 50 homolog [Uloborus diversus]|uniref:sorting and assembly machinery component 50 homolog n=1 Tax=Uloborus diversus TaxID=327109 RepID=UPI00240A32E7|nr:sorting and assembly machinery component 50 homolog [Uloborus diversus]XP_054718206.1 sorting and assembly machinery component 50 homolog [Uloborus diversus]